MSKKKKNSTTIELGQLYEYNPDTAKTWRFNIFDSCDPTAELLRVLTDERFMIVDIFERNKLFYLKILGSKLLGWAPLATTNPDFVLRKVT
jgi:hypothetical protein